MKIDDDFIQDLEAYAFSLEEGDNITVTCDLINTLQNAYEVIKELKEKNKLC